MSHKQLQDLDALIKRVRETKTAAIKTASPGDGVEDGTKKPETGAQMASNKAEAAKGTKAMVDGGAKANAVGASVEASTEGATAVATSGKKGTEGADLKVVGQAPNGPEGGIKGDKKTAAITSDEAKSIAESLRKVAGEMATKSETATQTPKGSEVNEVKQAAAATSFVCFLKRAAEAAGLSKKAADAMPMGAPPADAGAAPAGAPPAGADAGAAGGDQGADVATKLLQAIQSGQVSEEDAEKMLMEAAQSGAISQEEVMAAMQAMHAQGGAAGGAGAGAPPAGAPPMGAPPAAAGAAGGAGPGDPQMNDPALEAKMAAAEIGPEHPLYVQKLAALYEGDMKAGYAFAIKLGEEMAPAGHEAPPADPNDKKPMGQPAGDAPSHGHEDHAAVLQPKSPEEQQALMQVLAQMGITPEDLKQLVAHQGAAPAACPADPAQAKVAAARPKIRAALFAKLAEYHESLAQNQK